MSQRYHPNVIIFYLRVFLTEESREAARTLDDGRQSTIRPESASSANLIGRRSDNEAHDLNTGHLIQIQHDSVSSYQELLTSMVSALDDEHQNHLLWESEIWFEANKSRGAGVHNEGRENNVSLQITGKPRSGTPRLSVCKMESPCAGRVSVDPLHYLPISPTVQNGELFKLCEFLMLQKYVASAITHSSGKRLVADIFSR